MSDYFYEDYPDCVVVVEPGIGFGPQGSFRIIGAMANSEKGVTFLTAYCQAKAEEEDDDGIEIESASFPPEELDRLKRQAALAGVSLKWTGRDTP